MAVRNITKQLAGYEDLLLGKGTEVQQRSGGSTSITKVDLLQPVDVITDLKALDVAKFTKAMTLGQATINDGSGAFYYFDIADTTTPESLPDIVIPDSIVGRWKRLTLLVS